MLLRTFRTRFADLLNEAWPVEIDPDDNVAGETQTNDDEGPELPEGAVMTAAALVVEWQGSEGTRWLSRYGTLGNGDALPRWSLEMLYREGLHWDRTP
jgi:hypothetical protein